MKQLDQPFSPATGNAQLANAIERPDSKACGSQRRASNHSSTAASIADSFVSGYTTKLRALHSQPNSNTVRF
ncbi:hypothetical protein ACFVMC_20690 [Nocardia sp. NPDC127579]|uniref:hypothetical protein n=1 Tax=Nocardia sp. NPDC127579 TaxID=3345402 RepID=UPI00362FCC12